MRSGLRAVTTFGSRWCVPGSSVVCWTGVLISPSGCAILRLPLWRRAVRSLHVHGPEPDQHAVVRIGGLGKPQESYGGSRGRTARTRACIVWTVGCSGNDDVCQDLRVKHTNQCHSLSEMPEPAIESWSVRTRKRSPGRPTTAG